MGKLQDFYSEQTILVTGCTGFIGKILLEKLIRCCTCKKIYVLIRAKYGASAKERFYREILNKEVFDKIRYEFYKKNNKIFNNNSNGLSNNNNNNASGYVHNSSFNGDYVNIINNSIKKYTNDNKKNNNNNINVNNTTSNIRRFNEWIMRYVHPIDGDLQSNNLGLSNEDFVKLTQEVSVIFNCAASVLFNIGILENFETNVLGSLRVLEFAHRCVNLVSMVHTSTAYVNCDKIGRIEEKVYPTTFDTELLFQLLLNSNKHTFEEGKLEELLLGRYPNSYCFAKCLAENVLASRRGKIPLCFLRPSIVGSTYREPFRGWVENANAAGAIYLLASLSLIDIIPCDPEVAGDQVPADYVANSIIICAVRNAYNYDDLCVVHCASTHLNPCTWGENLLHVREYLSLSPFDNTIINRSANVTLQPDYNKHKLDFFIRRKAVAALGSALSSFLPFSSEWKRQIRRFNLGVEKAEVVLELLKPFTYNEWIYETNNIITFFNDMQFETEEEKISFAVDPRTIDWREFFHWFMYGLARWILRIDHAQPPFGNRYINITSKNIIDLPLVSSLKTNIFKDFEWAFFNKKDPKNEFLFNKEKIKQNVFSSAAVLRAIEDETERRTFVYSKSKKGNLRRIAAHPHLIKAQVETEAYKMFEEMEGNYIESNVRILAWVLLKAFRRFYENILVDIHEIQRTKKLIESIHNMQKKENKNIPIILLPTHRSYIDSLLISFVCFTFDIKLPFIAADEAFSNLFFVGNILRNSAAFFLKRQNQSDYVHPQIDDNNASAAFPPPTPPAPPITASSSSVGHVENAQQSSFSNGGGGGEGEVSGGKEADRGGGKTEEEGNSNGYMNSSQNTSRKTTLFRSILKAYVQNILKYHQMVEFFIEGGRSRTGLMLPSKKGLLSWALEMLYNNEVDDICIIPVTINYERILEGETFPMELLGEEKKKESTLRIINSIRYMTTHFGNVHIRISEHLSAKHIVDECISKARNSNLYCNMQYCVCNNYKDDPSSHKNVYYSNDKNNNNMVLNGRNFSSSYPPVFSLSSSSNSSTINTVYNNNINSMYTNDSNNNNNHNRLRISRHGEEVNKGGMQNTYDILHTNAYTSNGSVKNRKEKNKESLNSDDFYDENLPSTSLSLFQSPSSSGGCNYQLLNEAQKRLITEYVSDKVLGRLNDELVSTVTNIVATVLLMNRKGIKEEDLITQFDWLKNEILIRGGNIAFSCVGSNYYKSEKLVKNVCFLLLNKCINRSKTGMFEIIVTPKINYTNILLLAYYRNQLFHVFINEAFVIVVLLSFGHVFAYKEGVQENRLIEEILFLVKLMKNHFVSVKNKLSAKCMIVNVLKYMTKSNTLHLISNSNNYSNNNGNYVHTSNDNMQNNISNTNSNNNDDYSMTTSSSQCIVDTLHTNKRYIINKHFEGRVNLLSWLLWPFIDSYWVVGMSLFRLLQLHNHHHYNPHNYTQQSYADPNTSAYDTERGEVYIHSDDEHNYNNVLNDNHSGTLHSNTSTSRRQFNNSYVNGNNNTNTINVDEYNHVPESLHIPSPPLHSDALSSYSSPVHPAFSSSYIPYENGRGGGGTGEGVGVKRELNEDKMSLGSNTTVYSSSPTLYSSPSSTYASSAPLRRSSPSLPLRPPGGISSPSSFHVSVPFSPSSRNAVSKKISYKKLAESAHWLAESMYHEKTIVFYESCALDHIKRAIQGFQLLGVIELVEEEEEEVKEENGPLGLQESQPFDASDQILFQLTPPYLCEAELQAFVDRIGQFRKDVLGFSSAYSTNVSSKVLSRQQMVSNFPVFARL